MHMTRKFSPRELEIFSELNRIGYTQRDIANLVGMSQATISRILRSEKLQAGKEVKRDGEVIKPRT